MTLGKASYGLSVVKGTYNIGFNDGDETQFDVANYMELFELWIGFCKENDVDIDSVDYVEAVEDEVAP
jgi:hypothetical protein